MKGNTSSRSSWKKILLLFSACCLIFAILLLMIVVESNYHRVPSAAWRCLRAPRNMALLSIDPDYARELKELDAPGLRDAVYFHGLKEYLVLGATEIRDEDTRHAVATAVKWAVLRANPLRAKIRCFDPRHAIRFTDDSGDYEFLICFECKEMWVYVDGKRVAAVPISGSPDSFNEILKAAHVPLPTH
jgi:hypothetical protein